MRISTDVERLPGALAGNISIFWFEHGWFWLIPLQDGTTSIGAVCWPSYLRSRETNLEQFLLDTIALSPKLAERMKHARPVLRGQGRPAITRIKAACHTARSTCCSAMHTRSWTRCSRPACSWQCKARSRRFL